ncbi:MAG: branched-chain amino acid ABC transporter substrate-binding protein [Desulfobacteraceae bacterium]|nr:MAG: branched-chain amino acid ABC transporter substrate-binding protein [Desulfobacteraceae bacterium]
MKNRVQILIVSFIFIVGLFCLPLPQALAKDSMTVGFSMSLTGKYAPGAAGQMQSYQLWEETVNKQGGIYVKKYGKKLPVKLVYYDDKSETGTAVRVYEKLITEDKVDVVLSPYGTAIHFAVAPMAERYKVPIVGSTAASVKFRDIKTRYFWFITSCLADRQMQALVDLLKHLGVRSVAIIYAQELFPRENLQFLDPYVKEAGFNVLIRKDYPMGAKDLTTLLSQVKGKNPEAVIALCYPAGAFTITTQAQEVGLNPKFFFELVGPCVVVFGPKFGAATEGIATMGHWSPKGKWPGAKDFYDQYMAKFNKKPDYLNSVLAYTSCQILQQAIQKVGSFDWNKLRDYIANNEFQTINGPIKFTGTENMRTPSMILQWQKGEVEIIWPEATATAKPLYPKPVWPK